MEENTFENALKDAMQNESKRVLQDDTNIDIPEQSLSEIQEYAEFRDENLAWLDNHFKEEYDKKLTESIPVIQTAIEEAVIEDLNSQKISYQMGDRDRKPSIDKHNLAEFKESFATEFMDENKFVATKMEVGAQTRNFNGEVEYAYEIREQELVDIYNKKLQDAIPVIQVDMIKEMQEHLYSQEQAYQTGETPVRPYLTGKEFEQFKDMYAKSFVENTGLYLAPAIEDEEPNFAPEGVTKEMMAETLESSSFLQEQAPLQPKTEYQSNIVWKPMLAKSDPRLSEDQMHKDLKNDSYLNANDFGQVRNYYDNTVNINDFGMFKSGEYREKYQNLNQPALADFGYGTTLKEMQNIQAQELQLAATASTLRPEFQTSPIDADKIMNQVVKKHDFERKYFEYRDCEEMNKPISQEQKQELRESYMDYKAAVIGKDWRYEYQDGTQE